MKFNLELAKKGFPVKTKDGRAVKIVEFDLRSGINGDHHEMIVVIPNKGADDTVAIYDQKGYCYHLEQKDADNDTLVMALPTTDGWVNIYLKKDGTVETGHVVWATEDLAKDNTTTSGGAIYVATVHIAWGDIAQSK